MNHSPLEIHPRRVRERCLRQPVVALLNPATASARRLAKAAKEAKRPCYVDMSFGRATKCLML